jgi:hypothetical protein
MLPLGGLINVLAEISSILAVLDVLMVVNSGWLIYMLTKYKYESKVMQLLP